MSLRALNDSSWNVAYTTLYNVRYALTLSSAIPQKASSACLHANISKVLARKLGLEASVCLRHTLNSLISCVDGGSWSQEYCWASGEMR
jgi:hypothetical protein